MHSRVLSLLLGLALGLAILGPGAWGFSTTPETDDAAGGARAFVGATTKKLLCSQTPGFTLNLPNTSGATIAACSTSTIVPSDICSNTANGIPCLDSDTKVDVSVLPTSVQTGTGTTNYLARWASESKLTPSKLHQTLPGSWEAWSVGAYLWDSIAVDPVTKTLLLAASGLDIFESVGGTNPLRPTSASHSGKGVSVNWSNGDRWTVVSGVGIFKSAGGTGPFDDQGAPALTWNDLNINPSNGDVWAVTADGDIYKSAGGTGAWTLKASLGISLTGVSVNWSNGDVWICSYSGIIYKLTGGSGTFSAKGSISGICDGIAVDPATGDVWFVAYSGNIYKSAGGTTWPADGQGAPSLSWTGIAVDYLTGTVWACATNYSGIYRKLGPSVVSDAPIYAPLYTGLTFSLNGATSGTVTHGVAAATASYSMLDPATAPAEGQAIVYPSGGGQGTWTTPIPKSQPIAAVGKFYFVTGTGTATATTTAVTSLGNVTGMGCLP
jgi:hypothetical protein